VTRDHSSSLDKGRAPCAYCAALSFPPAITTIIGAAELLLTGAEDDSEARRRFLKHILSEGRRMQRLSDTLLRLARIGAERREPTLRSVHPGVVARRAIERIEPLAQSAGVTIEMHIDEGSWVRADPEQLEQILLALLSNAVQHSESGRRVRLRVSGRSLGVEDEGSGIDPEDIPTSSSASTGVGALPGASALASPAAATSSKGWEGRYPSDPVKDQVRSPR
jgi:signal transduction histidine kinase